MKTITAKFKSKCAETGREIRKGEQCMYDYRTKKVYCLNSNAAMMDPNPAGSMIQANEDAYFDNWCATNY